MTTNEIKKMVYKQKPKAYLEFIRIGMAYYYTSSLGTKISFQIPISDMGSTDFLPEMEAKLLLRWLVNEEN